MSGFVAARPSSDGGALPTGRLGDGGESSRSDDNCEPLDSVSERRRPDVLGAGAGAVGAHTGAKSSSGESENDTRRPLDGDGVRPPPSTGSSVGGALAKSTGSSAVWVLTGLFSATFSALFCRRISWWLGFEPQEPIPAEGRSCPVPLRFTRRSREISAWDRIDGTSLAAK